MANLDKNQYYHGNKVRLYLTDDQANYIDKFIDLSRYVYNWALEQQLKQYELYKNGNSKYSKLSFYDLRKMFTKLRNDPDKIWLKELPYKSAEIQIKRSVESLKRFLNGLSDFPKFKSKKYNNIKSIGVNSFRLYFENNMVKIPGIDSLVYTRYNSGYNRHSNIKFYNTVVSKDNFGRYYLSYNIVKEKPVLDISEKSESIGIDLNVKKRIVLSNGKLCYAPNTKKIESQIKKYHKQFSRALKHQERTNLGEVKLSNRANKKRLKLAKKYNKLHNVIENFIQNATTEIIRNNPSCIVMEDISIKKLEHDRNYIAKYTHQASFFRIRYIMELKCDKYNIPFKLAPKDYKSSSICSCCGYEKNIGSYHKFICPNCGAELDRDINAAINLRKLA